MHFKGLENKKTKSDMFYGTPCKTKTKTKTNTNTNSNSNTNTNTNTDMNTNTNIITNTNTNTFLLDYLSVKCKFTSKIQFLQTSAIMTGYCLLVFGVFPYVNF